MLETITITKIATHSEPIVEDYWFSEHTSNLRMQRPHMFSDGFAFFF